MSSKYPDVLLVVLSAVSMLLLGTMVLACDDAPAKESPTASHKPKIEFKDRLAVGNGKDDDARGSITITIKLDGLKEEREIKIRVQGRAIDGDSLAMTVAGQLGSGFRGPFEWKFTRDGKEIVIEGWTDPKTKKFHPVTSMKVEATGIRKEDWPTIKLPPNL